MKTFTTFATLSVLAASTFAQTYTSCNPLNTTCPADPALGTTFNQTYDGSSSLSSSYWNIPGYPDPTFPSTNTGAAFTITNPGDAPTVETEFYIMWGSISVLMQAASGTGIISSIVLLSDDLDEIDWEVMGGNTTHVETNYYGKGNVSQINSEYYACNNPQGGLHNYTVDWSSGSIQWILDGQVVRTLTPQQAVDTSGNTMYPQTPMQLKIGNWAGGGPTEPPGTVAWAGGSTDFNQAPFTMNVQSVTVRDGTVNATEYKYGDMTGNWQSIQVQRGVSKASATFHAPPPLTLSQRWAGLSSGARIAIVCSIAGVLAALSVGFVFFCIRQRRLGRTERRVADAMWEKEQTELLEYKRQMADGKFGSGGGMMKTPDVRYTAMR